MRINNSESTKKPNSDVLVAAHKEPDTDRTYNCWCLCPIQLGIQLLEAAPKMIKNSMASDVTTSPVKPTKNSTNDVLVSSHKEHDADHTYNGWCLCPMSRGIQLLEAVLKMTAVKTFIPW